MGCGDRRAREVASSCWPNGDGAVRCGCRMGPVSGQATDGPNKEKKRIPVPLLDPLRSCLSQIGILYSSLLGSFGSML